MKRLILLLLLVLAIRLLALPHTSVTNEGDSVTRVWIAWEWLQNPTWMTHGGWEPLHFYLIAGALRIWFNPIFSPGVLHILFSIATAVPVWAFVRREWGETAGIFVAAIFLFYPLSFRFSFMAISEIPFLFFVACALYFLSMARTNLSSVSAFFAGMSLTLAAAVRFEAWLLIPLFALTLWGRWKLIAVFVASASIFPVYWTFGNISHGHGPFPHLSTLKTWSIQVEGFNENLDSKEIIRRLLYFPSVVFFGLTPSVAVICLFGAVSTLRDKNAQAVWLIPIAILFPVYIIRGAQLGAVQARYSMLLGLLFMPFAAATVNKYKDKRWAAPLAISAILMMLPLSYSRVVFHRMVGPSVPNPVPGSLEAFPKVEPPVMEIADLVAGNLEKDTNQGLLIDFFGKDFYSWKDTYYAGLMSRLPPWRIFVMPGGRYQPLDQAKINRFLDSYPTGTMLHSNTSRFIHIMPATSHISARIHGVDRPLFLRRLTVVKSITLYDYSVHFEE